MPTPFLKENSKYFLPRKVVEDLPKKKKKVIYIHKKRKDIAELLKFLLRNQISTHCQFSNSPVYHLPREIKIRCRDPPEAPCVCFFPGCVEASQVLIIHGPCTVRPIHHKFICDHGRFNFHIQLTNLERKGTFSNRIFYGSRLNGHERRISIVLRWTMTSSRFPSNFRSHRYLREI